MTLDYRMPDTREHRVLQVMAELQNEQVIDWMLAVAKLIFGVPLCLVPALFITPFLYPMTSEAWHSRNGDLALFCLVSAVVVPVLIFVERRERQHYLWEASQEWFGMWLLDLLLVGPRMLWSVYDSIRQPPPTQETVALAATITVEMLDADRTIDIRELLSPDGTVTEVTQALHYLEHRGWVCVSRNRARAWLGTSVRKQFASLR